MRSACWTFHCFLAVHSFVVEQSCSLLYHLHSAVRGFPSSTPTFPFRSLVEPFICSCWINFPSSFNNSFDGACSHCLSKYLTVVNYLMFKHLSIKIQFSSPAWLASDCYVVILFSLCKIISLHMYMYVDSRDSRSTCDCEVCKYQG